MELTNEQTERQDFVDNAIFDLIQRLNPSEKEIDWDIEMIGEVRDCLRDLFSEKISIIEMNFYPFLENGN